MYLTEVRIKIMPEGTHLKAFACMTIDRCFVVRDLKIIEGKSGVFVTMPDRHLKDHCPACGRKNRLQAHYCDNCGIKLADNRYTITPDNRPRLYADVAHPISQSCRDRIQTAVLHTYRQELAAPGSTLPYRTPEEELEQNKQKGEGFPPGHGVELED